MTTIEMMTMTMAMTTMPATVIQTIVMKVVATTDRGTALSLLNISC
jgi:hypothetical protein